MSAADLRRRAWQLRREADRLHRIAVAIEAEHWGLTRAFRRMWPLFEPTTWQGPAADRSYDGAQQARRDARRAFEHAAQHALAIRREARDLRDRADHLEGRAARLEAAAEAAARAAAAAAAAASTSLTVPGGCLA